jgi:hypothetical protein
MPSYFLHLAEGAANSIVGIDPRWGIWALLVFIAAMGIGLMRDAADRGRMATIGFALLVYWGLLTVARGGVGLPLQSRYIYPGAALLVLLLVEAARRVVFPRGITVILALVTAFAVVGGTLQLRNISHAAQTAFNNQRAELRSLLGDESLPPGHEPDPKSLPGVRKGPLEAAVRDLGYPAGTRP